MSSSWAIRPIVPIMRSLFLIVLGVFVSEVGGGELPFDRAVINRSSLDGLPRSLSIRQEGDLWLGYDLERAKVFKVWQAPKGKPGLAQSGFVTKSVGKVRFEDKSDTSWELKREGVTVPLTVRYLGCTQRQSAFKLSLELQHAGGKLKLHQRVPLANPSGDPVATLEVRVEDLAANERLLLPSAARKDWRLTLPHDKTTAELIDSEWYRLALP